jgi:hypothetical protein
VAVEDMRQNAAELVQKLERGDADSSGSTLRTVGIVVLVVAVIGVLGAAVMLAANGAASSINATSFTFK